MMKSVTAFTLALALATPAFAQTSASQSAVRSGLYRIEPNHTRVIFSVSHLGFTTYYGEFVGASGTLDLKPANLSASHLDVSVPIAGIMTPSQKLDDELKGAEWFDASKFPAMTFHSTAVTATGPGTADVTGDLTLHGVTKTVILKAKFNAAGVNPLDNAYTTGFEVRGKIERSDFGVTKYVPLVGNDVSIIISAAFERAPG
jgi:polyisoprenoid-binding protein YceI